MATETVDLTWSDLKQRLMLSLDEGKPWGQAMQGTLRQMYAKPYAFDSFRNCSGADLLGWLRDGFYAPELAASAETRIEVKPRPIWSEDDGDVDLGRLYGGFDDFYYAMGEREGKPGMTLRIDLFFAALVQPSTIKDYGAFLAGLIGGLEAQGIDLQIELVLPIRKLYTAASERARQDVRILVKSLGELSDFTEWSACFSPASTRVLMFTAFGVASDKIGRKQTDHMATSLEPTERRWGIDYDADANVLTITASQRASGEHACPVDRLTADLKEAGLL